MDDLYNKIVRERGSWENLAQKIPGFEGYMEMSARREADRMIREHVAGKFKMQLDRIPQIERDLMAAAGGLQLMDRTKNLKIRLDNLQRRIASDTPGYSGFFANNKIGSDDLQRVYAFDEAMTRYADDLAVKLDDLAKAVAANEDTIGALAAVETLLQEAGQAYDLRDDILKGLA